MSFSLTGPIRGLFLFGIALSATAVALGCSGHRCHDVQFTPPRYIVTCANACWVTTAERRQRGAVCRTCHGPVRYTTYTEYRWQQATTRA